MNQYMKLRILIIDDDIWYKQQFIDSLKIQGHQIFSAETAEKAFEIIGQQQQLLLPVDLVFIDYIIPGDDGIEISREIKQMAPLIMQVGFTEHDDKDTKRKLIKEGVFTWVMSKFAEDAAFERIINMAMTEKRMLRKEGLIKNDLQKMKKTR